MITYKPFEPYAGTKFGVGGITSIKVQLANTADPAIPAETGKMYRLELSFE